ncbi:hypothetical protein DPMN_172508, partial [Dreissena polymorpha]
MIYFRIKGASGVDFCDMLYFEDEKEHLAEVAGTCTDWRMRAGWLAGWRAGGLAGWRAGGTS